MLTLLGDALNWAAVAIVFPLMLLPLAQLAGRKLDPAGGSVLWAGSTMIVAGAGAVFASLAPRVWQAEPAPWQAGLAAGIIVLAGLCAAMGGPAKAAAKLSPVFAFIARKTGRLALWGVIAMALIQFSAVILRHVFGVNFILVQESVTYLHGAVFLLAAGYALLTDDHVRVDVFYRDASPRWRAIVDLAGTYAFLFPFCLLVLWTSSPYVGASWSVFEGSPEQSGLQGVFVLKTLIPVFATLLSMAGFVRATQAADLLSRRGD